MASRKNDPLARKAQGKSTDKPRGAGRVRAKDGTRPDGAERIPRMGAAASQIVFDAASLLDEEVAAGIVTARKMQQRFQKERRLDAEDFKEALQRFQGDAHQMVSLLRNQFAELSSQENTETVSRLLDNAHNLIDLVAGLVDIGAEVANQLIQANVPAPSTARRGKRSG